MISFKLFRAKTKTNTEKKYEGPERRVGPRRTISPIRSHQTDWGGRRKSDISEELVMDKPVHTKTISADELMKHIGRAKIKSIAKHPFHREYISGVHAGYQYHRTANGHEHVLAAPVEALKRKDGTETRRMVHFDFYKRSVDNAHLFHNKNNERHHPDDGGNRMWHYIKSHKEDKK